MKQNLTIIADPEKVKFLVKKYPADAPNIKKWIKEKEEYFNRNPFVGERRITNQRIKEVLTFFNPNPSKNFRCKTCGYELVVLLGTPPEKCDCGNPRWDEIKDKFELEVYTDEELETYVPPEQRWLVQNQIPKAAIGLLVGKRGERKTWVAMRAAYGLGSGTPIFEDKVPEAKRVLFLDAETGKGEMANRRNLVKKGMGLKDIVDVRFLSFSGLKLDKIESRKFQHFKQLIEDFKPELVIVDCLQRFVSFDVDRENAMVSELFTAIIQPMINLHEMSWLFIHHLRKGVPNGKPPEDLLDEVRGGSEIVNLSRYVLLCQEPRHQSKTDDGSQLLVFTVIKMSNAPKAEAKVLKFTPVKDGLAISYEGKPADVLATGVRVGNAIKTWLVSEQIIEFRTKEMNEAAEKIGFQKTLLSGGLATLVKSGWLTKPKRGYYEVSGATADKTQKQIGFEGSGIKPKVEDG